MPQNQEGTEPSEGTEPHYPGHSVLACLATLYQCLLCMQAPQAHQASVTKPIGVVISDVLATGTGYYHHHIPDGHDRLVWEPLRAGHWG